MVADPHSTHSKAKRTGVRHIIIAGVFWRILTIELVLLVFSLTYRAWSEPSSMTDLGWYALRILILVGIILIFVTVSLSRFLDRKIIRPLEAITRANLDLDLEAPVVNPVALAEPPPDEIREIVEARQRIHSAIIKRSEERQRLVNFIRDTFGRYLSKKLVDRILASPDARKLGGRRAEVTILMADLRGFTGLTDIHDPEHIVSLLNRFFGVMAEIIQAYDGMIDEFLGDAMFVIFGVPERHDDDAARAVACAVEMQNAMARLNRDIAGDGFPPLQMGIGINTGQVVVGNIGSEIHAKYGIVGTPVNTAARIESIASGGEVLIGEPTYRLLQGFVVADPPQSLMMKGFRRPLVYYRVTRIEKPRPVALEQPVANIREIPIQLPFVWWKVSHKTVDAQAGQGQTVSMNADDLSVALDERLPSQTQVKLQIQFCSDFHCFDDLYANVVRVEGERPPFVHRLRITAMARPDRELLQRWLRSAA
jgi:class 3 adenylate cyclase